MPEVLAQLDRDQVIWTKWVEGRTYRELAEEYDLDPRSIGRAIARYRASLPEEDRLVLLDRALGRLEELYAAHRERALTSTRAASLITRIIALEARLLGLEAPTKVEHSGEVWTPDPPVDPVPPVSLVDLLDQWRRDGRLRVRGELVRLDREAGP